MASSLGFGYRGTAHVRQAPAGGGQVRLSGARFVKTQGAPVSQRQPIFNAPAAVVGLLALLIAIHVARLLISEQQDWWVISTMSLIPVRLGIPSHQFPGGLPAQLAPVVTHMLLHGDFAHLLINAAWLLIFGTVVARRLGSLRFVLFTLAAGIAAALVFVAANPGGRTPMVGASGAVSGLMGAMMLLYFPAQDRGWTRILAERPGFIPRMSVRDAVTDRRWLAATGVIVALNLLLGTSVGNELAGSGIAWEAHLGGYFAGVLGFGLFDRGAGPTSDQPSARPARPGDDNEPPRTLH
jgi:membrane associated rhomboid family serine protease